MIKVFVLRSLDWELVFRAASDTETDVIKKWLDTTRGYAEYDPKAKSILKEDSPLTYKNSIVNDWANVGITKVSCVCFYI